MSTDPFDPGDPWVHPLTDIHPTVSLGRGTKVWAFVSLQASVTTGPNCSFGTHVYVGQSTTLGDNVRVQSGCHLTDHMTVGSRVFFGPNVTTMNDRHPRVNNPKYRREPPIIEDDVTVGAGAVILPGVRLGQGCTVGAGAVVTKNVAPYRTVVGCPAQEVSRKSEVA